MVTVVVEVVWFPVVLDVLVLVVAEVDALDEGSR